MENLFLLLIVGLIFTIYVRLKGIWSNYKCFNDEILDDYFHGRLKREEDLRRKVVTHLGLCDKCQQKMYELQSGQDSSIDQQLAD